MCPASHNGNPVAKIVPSPEPLPSRIASEAAAIPLYATAGKIYPRAVHGWFGTWRWTLVWVTQLAFYGGA